MYKVCIGDPYFYVLFDRNLCIHLHTYIHTLKKFFFEIFKIFIFIFSKSENLFEIAITRKIITFKKNLKGVTCSKFDEDSENILSFQKKNFFGKLRPK